MYQATDISLHIRERNLLNKVSITVRPGAFTAVVGPNGAGKSTLLKVLAQELVPGSGSVTINGRNLSAYRPRALSLLRAVLPQHSTVQFAFTAEQIVMLGRHAHRTSRQTNQAIVEEVLELTGISAYRGRGYGTLSGGEKQRVQLARVFAQVWEETVYPRYILLDEPTSSLDIAQQQLIFDLARQVCKRNIGVMAIIHDLNHAVLFADDLYFLRDGAVVDSGQARNVFTKKNIETTFCCAVNFYHDPCNNCPYIIPAQQRPGNTMQTLKIN